MGPLVDMLAVVCGGFSRNGGSDKLPRPLLRSRRPLSAYDELLMQDGPVRSSAARRLLVITSRGRIAGGGVVGGRRVGLSAER